MRRTISGMNGQHTDEWYAKAALGRIKGRDVDTKRSVDLVLVQHLFQTSWFVNEQYHEEPGKGAYYGSADATPVGLMFACPGCGQVTATNFGLRERRWQWNGNIEKPTLTPSIMHDRDKGGCGWHGWLTDGRFNAV